MSISPIFTFAPIPLTSELSPLAHAAILIRKRQADHVIVTKPRHRINPPVEKPENQEKQAAEAALV
jgi:hypothetical protein